MAQPAPAAAPATAPSQCASFDEFRLYYESAERVTDRRHELNRWNYSVAAATLIAIGLVLNWSIGRPSHVLIGVCAIVILCVMAIVLCTYWVKQISDLKALNAAKFEVLNEMAPLLAFEGSSGAVVATSYRPFEREWAALQAGQQLTQVQAGGVLNLLVLKASRAEYFIPRAFRLLFIAILLAVLALSAASHGVVFDKLSPFSDVGASDTGTGKAKK